MILARGNLTLKGTRLVFSGIASGELAGADIALTGAVDEDNLLLTITATGDITLNSDIDLGSGDLILSSASIVLDGDITIMGGAISLIGAIDESAAIADAVSGKGGNDALTITAMGVIIINDDIHLGSGALTLAASHIMAVGSPTLTASAVSLMQDDAFAPDPLFTFDSSIGALHLTTAAAQTVHHGWMVVMNRDLSITSTGDLTIGADIETGAGDLTLGGGSIVLGGDITLTGAAITLAGHD